jgi:hypothetical protein
VKLKLPPGARLPFHRFVFDVDVCATLSSLTHVSVVPAGTVSGFAPKALVLAPDDPPPMRIEFPWFLDDEDDEGEDGESEPPQPAIRPAQMNVRMSRCSIGPPDSTSARMLPD